MSSSEGSVSTASSPTEPLVPGGIGHQQHQTRRISAAGIGGTIDHFAAQVAGILRQPQPTSRLSPQFIGLSPFILVSLRPNTSTDSDQYIPAVPEDDFEAANAPQVAHKNILHAHLNEYYRFGQAEQQHHSHDAEDDRDFAIQPHVYSLAARAFFYLRRTGQDQAIVFHSATNISNTGQQEHRRLATRALLSLSSNPNDSNSKSCRVAKQIQAAEFILDAFGSIGSASSAGSPLPTDNNLDKTTNSPSLNLSFPRFGRYCELQFSNRARIIGYKTLLYGLDAETGRIAFGLGGGVWGIQNRERSFDALRWLVSGASKEERLYLRLPEVALSTPAELLDKERFGLLKQALKIFGFPKKAVASLCSTLAAILHLSALQFNPSDSSDALEACTVANPGVLHTIAALLGLLDVPAAAQTNLDKLTEALTNKTAYIDGERCTVVLDVEKAYGYMAQLAKVLYKLVWEWLGEFINQKLCKDDFAGYIALVDFPALRNVHGHRNEGNSISTLCLNLASERLSAFVTASLFPKALHDSQVADKLPSSCIIKPLTAPATVLESIRVMTNQPGGLTHIIDDQSVRKGKTERTMLEAMGKRWGKNRQFAWRKEPDSSSSRAGTFTIEHWSDAELVTYSTEDFIEKNLNVIPGDIVELLGGKAVPQMKSTSIRRKKTADTMKDVGKGEASIIGGSANAFVRELFANEVFAAAAAAAAASEKATIPSLAGSILDDDSAAGGLIAPGSLAARQPSFPKKKGAYVEEAKDSGAAPTGLTRKKTVTAKRAELLSQRCLLGHFNRSLNELFETISESCRVYTVYCLSPYSGMDTRDIDIKLLKSQIKALQLNIVKERCTSVTTRVQEFDFKDFWDRYSVIDAWQLDLVKRAAQLMWTDKMICVREEMRWSDQDFTVGKTKVHLSDAVFRSLEDYLRAADQEEQKRKREFKQRSLEAEVDQFSPFSRASAPMAPTSPTLSQVSPFGPAPRPYNHPAYSGNASITRLPLVAPNPFGEDDDHVSMLTDSDLDRYTPNLNNSLGIGEAVSVASARNMFNDAGATEKSLAVADVKAGTETVELHKETSARKQWKFLVWCLTWWIPTFVIQYVGRMKRSDVRMAWREKVAIFILIMLMCASAVFVVAIMGFLICPREYVFSTAELADHSYANNQGHELIAIRGEVFDLRKLSNVHTPSVIPQRSVVRYGGIDASNIFPVQVSALCNGRTGFVSPWVTLDTSNTTDENAVYHDFRAFTNDSRPDWYWQQMTYMRYNYRRGFAGFTHKQIQQRAGTDRTRNTIIYNKYIYDMTGYINNNGGGVRAPLGFQAPPDTDRQFMHNQIVSLFQQFAGQDITNKLDNLNIDRDVLAAQKICMRNLFFIGKVDTRNSVQCQFSNYILLAFSIAMVAIIGFKFIAALQFSRSRQPENHDRFVILQVPCYTEGEESLRDCIESLAALKYDDKRKLLFVICDGMIVGSGNDRPTPRIVLDILGADAALDPEALSFQSLGEGAKQHNMGKVYSGLYEHAGHVIPYIVMVKVGTPSEHSRPGNRGKRDSQLVFMRLFNRIHFNAPLAPVELELYHQIKNVIGVNPTFYEFLLAIDADTVVEPLSLNRFISAMARDRKMLATCGETELANAKKTIISMIQVYEYFISHHLAKAFESLFGSVTCLPGCFSLYRLRSVENKPLFISNEIVTAFGENRVDTLHMKNLLHLGEDRYLTTLLLKTFPSYKLTFTRDAHAKTIAPEEWNVLLSQRRRWINSTIHNLAELIGRVDRLCGFCCCSMRAVVLVDLLSTLIQPVTVAYVVYLIYLVVDEGKNIPTSALIMLGAIYGLQAVVFLLHRKFEMIVWMVIYILAIPVFSFAIPMYSFWKQDDFSWGETRIVLGERGRKLVIHDEGSFDPNEIPLKSWHDYENELWEKGSNASIGQLLAEKEEADYARAQRGEGSIYGRESMVGFTSRPRTPMSELGARGFHQALNSGGHITPRYDGFGKSRTGSTVGISPYTAGAAQQVDFGGGYHEGYEMQSGNPYANRHSTVMAHQSRQSFGLMQPLLQADGQPADEQLAADIQAILAQANLQTLTKKAVREELERTYSVDLTARKAFINNQIEDGLTGLY